MMSVVLAIVRRTSVAMALCAAMAGLAASPAHARIFIGFGVPFFYPPPLYYPPPPVYYAPPPPVVYAPPPQQYSQAPAQGGYGQTCSAGAYVCPMDHPTAAGSNCYCLGNGGARVWGRAN